MQLIIILALIAACAVTVALYAKTSRKASDTAMENVRLAERLAASEASMATTREALLQAQSENKRLHDEFEQEKEKIRRQSLEAEERFSQLAAKVLMDNSEELRKQSRNGLDEVLAPMKENLENFRKTITDRYNEEARERFSLGERVRELVDLNQTVSRETRRLTDVLKGNSKLQGDWGEMILDNILERVGFRRGYEYTVQESVTDCDGRRLRPDVVINYTEGRKIIIDSKVSIQDYMNMVNAENDNLRQQYARAHVASVKKHISELRNKSYQDVVAEGRFDYVLMFIPHEGAFLAAMNLDNQLWQTAYDSHVLIISPTHLMSIVKLIEQMWRHDKQNRNALAIADEAGKMLDKFRGFLEDMDRLDKTLSQGRDAWNAAFSKLTAGPGNLIAKAQKLESLGAKSKKGRPSRYLPDESAE